MNIDLTQDNITKSLIRFAMPLMLANIMQQFYNITDTFIVGRFIGPNALASVGASYALIIFITSIIIGLCMGSGVFTSIQFGKRDLNMLKNGLFISFTIVGIFTLILNFFAYIYLNEIINILQIPKQIFKMTRDYLNVIFFGIFATFLYNYYSNMLRAIGNSLIPVIFLGVSLIFNIALDIIFIVYMNMGVFGAGFATVISQYICAVGVIVYSFKFEELKVNRENMKMDRDIIKSIANLSLLTSMQQSIMNFGILTVQGLVNSFGTIVMAAFSTAVKIDTLAYSPVQDFGNAYSTFIAQNYGAGNSDRIKRGTKISIKIVIIFCMVISSFVYIFAPKLMSIFVDKTMYNLINIGVQYLRIVSVFYIGIGILFMFYGYFRAINKAEISLVLTIISLGTRVALAFTLSSIPFIGIKGIWIAIPIGWILADLCGLFFYKKPIV